MARAYRHRDTKSHAENPLHEALHCLSTRIRLLSADVLDWGTHIKHRIRTKAALQM